jgi:NAD(P)-dependent dehydrogenase (short-subunit alcohol dehydrogenase family)
MQRSKSILITGASSGIGRALAQAFAGDGHRLFVCARREEPLAEIAREFPSIFFAKCDVAREADVNAFFAAVRERTASVDALVHCAGVIGPVGLLTEIESSDWFAAVQNNLFGAVLAAKAAVPLMKAEARPRILFFSGGGAFDPMPNLSAYGIAKAGIIRLAETLAVELAPRNIAVNAFAPGFIKTEIFKPLLAAGPKRGREQYDIVVDRISKWRDDDMKVPVECARFLLSDAAAKLTGKTISARHDPWGEPEFAEHLGEIVASKLYATQRAAAVRAQPEPFVEELAAATERIRRQGGL